MLIKITCPHCGEFLEIDSHKIAREILLEDVLTNGEIEYDSGKQKEYDPVKQSELNYFRQNNTVLSYEYPQLENLNTTCKYTQTAICFTGFTEADKEILSQLTTALNIQMKNSISSKVQVLVCGPNAGPAKKAKCKECGIPIVEAEEFLREISRKQYQ